MFRVLRRANLLHYQNLMQAREQHKNPFQCNNLDLIQCKILNLIQSNCLHKIQCKYLDLLQHDHQDLL